MKILIKPYSTFFRKNKGAEKFTLNRKSFFQRTCYFNSLRKPSHFRKVLKISFRRWLAKILLAEITGFIFQNIN